MKTEGISSLEEQDARRKEKRPEVTIRRILVPIVTALEGIDNLAKQKSPLMYMNAAFGSAEATKKAILVDFFRFGLALGPTYFFSGTALTGLARIISTTPGLALTED